MNNDERCYGNILKTTTNRRAYNVANKHLHAQCERCRWHANFWRHCIEQDYKMMYYIGPLDEIPERSKLVHIYNWKLVSKNKKQWMKKKKLLVRSKNYPVTGDLVIFGF